MALFDEDYDVGMAEGAVKQVESYIASQQDLLQQAKRFGESGDSYKHNIALGKESLKRRKEELARAKERAKEAKKRKQEEEKREAARQKEKEQQAKEEAKREAAAAKSSSSKSSSSSRSSSSSSRSSSSSNSGGSSSRSEDRKAAAEAAAAAELKRKVDHEVSSYMATIRSKYNINNASEKTLVLHIMELALEERRLEKERAAAINDELRRRVASECMSQIANYSTLAMNRYKKIMHNNYAKSLESKYPVQNNSAAYIAKCLPDLLREIEEQQNERKNNALGTTFSTLYYSQELTARKYATNACLRLKKLDVGLFHKPEIQEVVKKIDPTLESTAIKRIIDTLYAPYYWVEEKVRVTFKWATDKKDAAFKWTDDKKGAATKWIENKKKSAHNWVSNKMDLLKSKLKKH